MEIRRGTRGHRVRNKMRFGFLLLPLLGLVGLSAGGGVNAEDDTTSGSISSSKSFSFQQNSEFQAQAYAEAHGSSSSSMTMSESNVVDNGKSSSMGESDSSSSFASNASTGGTQAVATTLDGGGGTPAEEPSTTATSTESTTTAPSDLSATESVAGGGPLDVTTAEPGSDNATEQEPSTDTGETATETTTGQQPDESSTSAPADESTTPAAAEEISTNGPADENTTPAAAEEISTGDVTATATEEVSTGETTEANAGTGAMMGRSFAGGPSPVDDDYENDEPTTSESPAYGEVTETESTTSGMDEIKTDSVTEEAKTEQPAAMMGRSFVRGPSPVDDDSEANESTPGNESTATPTETTESGTSTTETDEKSTASVTEETLVSATTEETTPSAAATEQPAAMMGRSFAGGPSPVSDEDDDDEPQADGETTKEHDANTTESSTIEPSTTNGTTTNGTASPQMGRSLLGINLFGEDRRRRSKHRKEKASATSKPKPKPKPNPKPKSSSKSSPSVASPMNTLICPDNGTNVKPEPIKRVYHFSYKTSNGEKRFYNDTRLFPMRPMYYVLWMPTSTSSVEFIRVRKFVLPACSKVKSSAASQKKEAVLTRFYHKSSTPTPTPVCDAIEVGRQGMFKFNSRFGATHMYGVNFESWFKKQNESMAKETLDALREELWDYWVRAFGGKADDKSVWTKILVAEDTETATKQEENSIKLGKEPDLKHPPKMPDGGKFLALDDVYTEGDEEDCVPGGGKGSSSSGGSSNGENYDEAATTEETTPVVTSADTKSTESPTTLQMEMETETTPSENSSTTETVVESSTDGDAGEESTTKGAETDTTSAIEMTTGSPAGDSSATESSDAVPTSKWREESEDGGDTESPTSEGKSEDTTEESVTDNAAEAEEKSTTSESETDSETTPNGEVEESTSSVPSADESATAGADEASTNGVDENSANSVAEDTTVSETNDENETMSASERNPETGNANGRAMKGGVVDDDSETDETNPASESATEEGAAAMGDEGTSSSEANDDASTSSPSSDVIQSTTTDVVTSEGDRDAPVSAPGGEFDYDKPLYEDYPEREEKVNTGRPADYEYEGVESTSTEEDLKSTLAGSGMETTLGPEADNGTDSADVGARNGTRILENDEDESEPSEGWSEEEEDEVPGGPEVEEQGDVYYDEPETKTKPNKTFVSLSHNRVTKQKKGKGAKIPATRPTTKPKAKAKRVQSSVENGVTKKKGNGKMDNFREDEYDDYYDDYDYEAPAPATPAKKGGSISGKPKRPRTIIRTQPKVTHARAKGQVGVHLSKAKRNKKKSPATHVTLATPSKKTKKQWAGIIKKPKSNRKPKSKKPTRTLIRTRTNAKSRKRTRTLVRGPMIKTKKNIRGRGRMDYDYNYDYDYDYAPDFVDDYEDEDYDDYDYDPDDYYYDYDTDYDYYPPTNRRQTKSEATRGRGGHFFYNKPEGRKTVVGAGWKKPASASTSAVKPKSPCHPKQCPGAKAKPVTTKKPTFKLFGRLG